MKIWERMGGWIGFVWFPWQWTGQASGSGLLAWFGLGVKFVQGRMGHGSYFGWGREGNDGMGLDWEGRKEGSPWSSGF